MLCANARRARTLRRRMKHQEQRRRSASSSLRMIFWRIASSGSSGGGFSISAASYLEAASQVTAGFLFTAVPRIL